MKKIVAIILAGLMLLSLAACGEKDDDKVKIGVLEGSGMESIRKISIFHNFDTKLGFFSFG